MLYVHEYRSQAIHLPAKTAILAHDEESRMRANPPQHAIRPPERRSF
jgi:hypothetical protein